MKHYLVIGDPIKHSLSPTIYSALIKLHNLEADYSFKQVKPCDLENFFKNIDSEGISGFNVTMPHKQNVLKYVNFVSDEVRITQSANTITVKEDGLHAHTTDAQGFMRALASRGVDIKDKKIGILGAGGVCLPLVYEFVKSGANQIGIYNRTSEKSQSIAEIVLRETSFKTTILKTPNAVAQDCDVFINTTSLGMEGVLANFEDFSFLDNLRPGTFVCDLIYKPFKTELLSQAQSRGFETMNGLPMLVHQAIIAFEHFTGETTSQADVDAVQQALAL